ncbi:DUF2799 domain-containing protein [Marinobacterium arenosum]|uniref:DUF2799 domain-containing protein n=1 Tax=Marinobacterium arenosum TaxID=2862496 RepID=UPI001C97C950|nr:DUF2799 domain-containing protein [Marinobacterium arenosum]MBY4676391.1 DUF2799 domain-containing protein [Marinobacterium arenosum]
MRSFSLICLLLMLAGCASLDRQACLSGDWYSIGLADGRNGYPLSRIEAHDQTCADYGVVSDYEAYQQGQQKGLEEYCTPMGGFRAGRDGYEYYGLCEGEGEPVFLEAYQAGREAYRERKHLENLEDMYYFRSHAFPFHHHRHIHHFHRH